MPSQIAAISAITVPLSGDGFRASVPTPAPTSSPQLLPLPPVDSTPLSSGDRELVAQAVGELADYVQKAGAELNFRIDDDSGRVVVSLVDQADGTVLMQLPSEEALRIAKLLAKCQPSLIRAEA